MICLSHKGTLNLVDGVTQNYDKEVLLWMDNWRKSLQVFSCTHPVRNLVFELFCSNVLLGVTTSTA